jgi:beta-galactosidase
VDLWEVIYKEENIQLQGGYIWDWIDQALVKKDKNGKEFWAYGGDYGEGMPTDDNFLCNGIISADYTPHPAMWEVKYAYQNIWFEAIDLEKGEIMVKNFQDFLSLEGYEINWKISADGIEMAKGEMPELDILPHHSKIVQLNLPAINKKPGVEYFLDLSAKLKVAQPFRSQGFEVAHEQFQLPGVKGNSEVSKSTAPVKLNKDKDIAVVGENFVVNFDKATGELIKFEVNGYELIQKGPVINFWRAPNDNDKGSNMIGRLGIWRDVTKEVKLTSLDARQVSSTVVSIQTSYELSKVEGQQMITYNIYGDGKIEIESNLELAGEKLPDLPRFGMRWELPVNFDNLSYYGRGPHENYIDRNRSAFVNVYQSKVSDQYFEYARPQENGYKTGVRWFELSNENGVGLRVISETPVGFSALHNPIEDFDQETHKDFRHTNDIIKRDGVYVTTDMKMMGVAGDNSWGARPYPKYSIPAKNYTFRFSIDPIF